MKRIAQFETVSRSRFVTDYAEAFAITDSKEIDRIYDALKLPARATAGSAGYDFFAPQAFELKPSETIRIPTGIRARMEEGWVLMLFPRSGLGFKYRLQLDNTAGVIDSDYINAKNEGHIFCKLTNDSKDGKTLRVEAGEGFAQGIFLPFGITYDDEASQERHGGFGSTTNRKGN